jgi:hypothetical protein
MSKSFEEHVAGLPVVIIGNPTKRALVKIAAEVDALRKPGCRWKPYPADGPMPGCYDTACGQVHYLSEGNLADNHYKYCPYCGGEIEEDKHEVNM